MESSWRAETSTRTTLRVGLMSTTMDPASSTTSSRMRSNKSGVVSESEIRRFEEELEKPALLKKSSTISRKEFEKLKTIIEKRNRELQEFLLQINKSEAVYVCFLVDCTGSMQRYIDAVKSSVLTLAKKLMSIHASMDLKLAFVRYTDFDQPESNRTTSLQFTRDISSFETFVGSIVAQGGADGPEDVFGGLKYALTNLSWGLTENTNVLIHIADAPCHGKMYHSCQDDTYPTGDPSGITLTTLLERIIGLRVNYWFGRIGCATDQMIEVFNKELERMDTHFGRIHTFQALDDSVGLATAVTAAVVESVTATMISHTRSRSTLRPFKLDTTKYELINWAAIPVFKARQIKFKLPTYDEITSLNGSFEMKEISIYLKVAPHPFAQGGVRLAYHARAYFDADLSESSAKHVVLKLMKYTGARAGKYKHYIQELEAATVAAKLAFDYHAAIASKGIKATGFKFGVVKVVKFSQDPTDHTRESSTLASTRSISPTSSSSCISSTDRLIFNMETFIEGMYEKFTSNNGFVVDSELAREFSSFTHWTYAKTDGKVMVVDLQGVKNSKGIMLTDPAVHSTNIHRFGKTNLGPDGFIRFFKTHTCSDLCEKLGIQDIKPK